jgi:hypothetical protein
MISRKSPLLSIGSLVAIGCALYFGWGIPVQFGMHVETGNYRSDLFANGALKKIDAALNRKTVIDPFVYAGTFETPFRVCGDNPMTRKLPEKALPERPQMMLKGILQKSQPLAILEDTHGETYIRGVGEAALDQEIVKIQDNRVTLHDARGVYDLVVEEQ